MVAEPTSAPSAADVRPVGALIEATFALWHRSWKRTFAFGVVYGLAALLPGVALQGVFSQVALASIALLGGQLLPALPLPLPLPLPSADPLAVLGSALLRLNTPSTWLLLASSVLGIVASTTALIAGQGAIARGEPFRAALRRGFARTPATLGAWLVYTVLVLVAALPFFALLVGAFVAALGGDVVLLMIALVVVLVGGLLASVPLAWASIAFALSPFASALDGSGPIAAQLRSRALVRGHWWRCATVVSLPLLVYLGAGGTASSLLLMACGGVVVLRDGWMGLLDPGWLLWSQLLAVPLQAALLPLAFAGGVVMYEDLRPHRAAGA
ncbi:hypothetical protein [Chiayiivirga flava]|uniref:Glycerophosphoryl diester phosphodiesterase membrane domain-containing protein n=1 Tax=Chiayiivirga flava TaxID=659595 RepID=A0A7W8D914_9GAMM|nr:hypothetical protein [Chiayiivirga flava]MBB5209012.1 hypothetical protein [Chiayiivirga flava]